MKNVIMKCSLYDYVIKEIKTMAKIKVYQAKEENMEAVKNIIDVEEQNQLLKTYKIYTHVY